MIFRYRARNRSLQAAVASLDRAADRERRVFLNLPSAILRQEPLFVALRCGVADEEFLEDKFLQAFIAVTELGRLLSCVAKVGVGDPGLVLLK
jgi:hypothetical protein